MYTHFLTAVASSITVTKGKLMAPKRVLIVGLGIAGMSAALSLYKAGWYPVIIERAPNRRTGGYFSSLFPAGREAAQELNVIENIYLRSPETSDAWDVHEDGSRIRAPVFVEQPGNPESVLRGDIEEGLWQRIQDKVEVRFSTIPVKIQELLNTVHVQLTNQDNGMVSLESFDLVVGADGLRSTVREMLFGPHEQFMKPFGAVICAYQMRKQVPNYCVNDSIILASLRRALWVFPIKDHAPTVLFTYRAKKNFKRLDTSPIEELRRQFSDMTGKGIVEHALNELDEADDYIFDTVHQVRMPKWHTNRVVLLGDAAWCLTLYSGMGASSAMKGAAELGKYISRHDNNLDIALPHWEKAIRPIIKKHQLTTWLKAELFVPSTRLRFILRRIFIFLMGIIKPFLHKKIKI